MLRKIVHGFIAICFLAFAFLQLNDPDPFIWVLTYCCVAILAILEIFNISTKLYSRVLYLALFIFWLTYVPDFIEWARGGFISITGSMEAN